MKYKNLLLFLGLVGTLWAAQIPVYELQPFPEIPLPITRSQWNYYRHMKFRGNRLLILDQAHDFSSTEVSLFKNGKPVLEFQQNGAIQGDLCETGFVLASDTRLILMDETGRVLRRRALNGNAGHILSVACSKKGVFVIFYKGESFSFQFYPWDGKRRSFDMIPASVCGFRPMFCELYGFPDYDDVAFLFAQSQGYLLDARVHPPAAHPLHAIFMKYPFIFRMWPIIWEGKKAFLIELARSHTGRIPEAARRSSPVPVPHYGTILQDAGTIVVDINGRLLGRIRQTTGLNLPGEKTSNADGSALYLLATPTILPHNPNYRLRQFNVLASRLSQSP